MRQGPAAADLLLLTICLIAPVEQSVQQLRVGAEHAPVKALGYVLDVGPNYGQGCLDHGQGLL